MELLNEGVVGGNSLKDNDISARDCLTRQNLDDLAEQLK